MWPFEKVCVRSDPRRAECEAHPSSKLQGVMFMDSHGIGLFTNLEHGHTYPWGVLPYLNIGEPETPNAFRFRNTMQKC